MSQHWHKDLRINEHKHNQIHMAESTEGNTYISMQDENGQQAEFLGINRKLSLSCFGLKSAVVFVFLFHAV